MRFSKALVCLYGITSTTSAIAVPDTSALTIRSPAEFSSSIWQVLVKRRGGGGSSGGGGGRGGSSSSSSGSSSSSSSSSSGSGSSSSSSSSSGSRGGTTGSTSGSSSGSFSFTSRGGSANNNGGQTTTGSGAPRSFGGGAYYGGGAATPYRAGGISPIARVAPILILTPALALGAIWAYGAYAYPYGRPYTFYNSTRNGNETLPVQCWCQQYQVCGCDDNGNATYLSSLVGNGTNLNSTLIRRVNLNGTDTLVINGTLPNGTTAAGGTESPDAGASTGSSTATLTGAGVRLNGLMSLPGYWMMFVTVAGIVCTI